ETGQGTFARLIEQAFARQALPQNAKRSLQRTQPLGLDALNHELIAAARGIDVQVALADHFQSVFKLEPHRSGRSAPQDGPDLRRVVLQREIKMPRLRARQVRNLAADPYGAEAALQRALDLFGQLGNAQYGRGARVGHKVQVV